MHILIELYQFLTSSFQLLCGHTHTDGQDRKQYTATLARRAIMLQTFVRHIIMTTESEASKRIKFTNCYFALISQC